MDISTTSDTALMQQIGLFVQQVRIQQQQTQATIAQAAGVNRSTLVKLENGGGANLLSFIQILRALHQLHVLSNFTQTEPIISPIAMAKLQLKQRKRVRTTS
ncbi:helix-turn-helix domain-containing protein [Ferruginibacter yonginensis]|uniref:Helix-turn-helix domain-containing protein n=1 Tax=Ferruginibacter yonginensis TaxID=1310416 RepID=A0ABV8QLY2_9BACT